jgi:hypothetical protein
VTGQAAWYDLKVRVERACAADDKEGACTEPRFEASRCVPERRQPVLAYDAQEGRRR